MKKFRSEEALLIVGEPPPKHLSRLSKKGGHEPAEEDRIKNTYSSNCPPKKKRQPKLKAIIFGESNLDEGLADLWTAFKRGLGFEGGVYGKFARFIDPAVGERDAIRVEKILSRPLTIAEHYLIREKLMDEKEIREYRRLSTIYNVYAPQVEGPEELSPGLRAGAYEQIKHIEDTLFEPGGLEDKYGKAIAHAEEVLDLPEGSGRFDSESAGLGRFRRFGRYISPAKRRRPTIGDIDKYGKYKRSREDSDIETERASGYKLSQEEKEASSKQKLINVLNSYIAKDGILKQSEEFLVGFIAFIQAKYPGQNKLLSDLNRRLISIRAYNTYLSDIKVDSLDSNALRAKLNAYLQRVRPAISRMRDLQEKADANYGSDQGFPSSILNIPFTWINPETGVELTGEEKVD